jgi:membrane associated rhomboid family serine protease
MQPRLTATTILIALNVLVFLSGELGVVSSAVIREKLALYHPTNSLFGFWQFLTSLFVHGGFSHLLMNMIGLYSFGSLLERLWGPRRFVLFYLACGLGAGAVYTGVNQMEYRKAVNALEAAGASRAVIAQIDQYEDPRMFFMDAVPPHSQLASKEGAERVLELFRLHHTPVVGASGAIYGILTAFGFMFPQAKLSLIFLPVPIAAKFFIPGLLLLDLFSGVTGFSLFGGGIAHFGHIGGALIGFLLMVIWRRSVRTRVYG